MGTSSPIRAGYLRRSVMVEKVGSHIDLQFSLWSLRIPLEYIELEGTLAAFFRREIPASAVRDSRIPSRNLLALLEAQGCIASVPADIIRLREVGKLFHAIAAEWYKDYYSHRLWPMLREATISRRQLDAWMLRTYFLSRSAGVTAARCAALCTVPRIRTLFARNSLEEFDHCERYYKHNSGSSDIPAPVSSIAFDQQMLYLAEEDWLAHVFVALFQEKTAVFVRNAKSLYDRLAKHFSLGDIFEPWKEHIGFDIAHGHANDFAEAFNHEAHIEREQFLASVERARITLTYLIGGLEQILLAESAGDTAPAPAAEAKTLAQAFDSFCRTVRPLSQVERQSYTFSASLQKLAFRALSYCTAHRDVLLIGRLCEYASCFAHRDSKITIASPTQIAVENQLRESAYCSGKFVLALCILDHLLGSELLNDSIRHELSHWLSEQVDPPSTSSHAVCEHIRKSLMLGPVLWDRPFMRDPFGW
ncbi:hypothetical protein [Nitrosospira multiformis]|uniref:Uncharacterized protein n=1 Tax=Nitrosospira multiformis TaxID=1231 RepID=A0A1I7I573_9PROT|nr:hypothetical protein [Nitrosospira multiformis]SFU68105.1 hypothetical protein SAMN05216417_11471 [Nitrosospira multiformis]